MPPTATDASTKDPWLPKGTADAKQPDLLRYTLADLVPQDEGHPDASGLQFHLLSFEGPDAYARIGGLATRILGLSEALSHRGIETHLWFVGDPAHPGHESRGSLHLHRWCQWISAWHPDGCYDGDEAKASDYTRSLPPYLLEQSLLPWLEAGGRSVVLAEEWQTVGAVLALDAELRRLGLREQVAILWNANNIFGFDRVPWSDLDKAARITAVSRFMKHELSGHGVEALVIPNGLGPESYLPAEPKALGRMRRLCGDRLVLTKMARWDPDKRWLGAVETVAGLKDAGWNPLLVARGGREPHGVEVLQAMEDQGLRIATRSQSTGLDGLLDSFEALDGVDVLHLTNHVGPSERAVLFRGSDAVLANSSFEPFGLVGLEVMAVGGIACTGATGEDYAMAGHNALVLESGEAVEFLALYERLRRDPRERDAMRRAGRQTARRFAWDEVIDRNLMPRLELATH
ncbi:MAG: glycosyltransferase family 4 protein [Planctomycetota bacterium]